MKRLVTIFLIIAAYCQAQTSIAVNNAAVIHGQSPYNSILNGSTSVQWPNPGCWEKLGFTGTSIKVTYDTSALVTAGYAANIYPVIKWQVLAYPSLAVEVAWTYHQVASGDSLPFTLASSLTNGSHVLQLYLVGIDESGVSNRWTSGCPMSLIIDSYTVDTGKGVFAAPLPNGGYILTFGDSVTEGALALGPPTPSYAVVEDAQVGYQELLAQNLNMINGNVAFAGEAWTSGISNVPGLVTTYNQIIDTVPRVFSPIPNIVTNNMGNNGTVTAATVTAWMTSMRAALVAQDPVAGAACNIVEIVPFQEANQVAIQDGYNAYVAANPTDVHVFYVYGGITWYFIVAENSYGNPHLDTYGNYLISIPLTPLVPSPLSAGLSPASSP